MNNQAKPNNTLMYQVVLYGRALHPELFALKARRVVRHADYELESWLMNGSHLLRFEHSGLCACELVTDQDRDLPASGVVTAFQCLGEHDYEHLFKLENVNYITTVQTETLSENQFLSAFDEYMDFSKSNGALAHQWRDEAGSCLSIVDVQHQNREVHAQTYHLIASPRLVLRSQSIFELL